MRMVSEGVRQKAIVGQRYETHGLLLLIRAVGDV